LNRNVLGVGPARFAAKAEAMLADAPELHMAIAPLLEARNMMRKQKAALDKHLARMARAGAVCKRLMTVSGVGPIVSLLFKATVTDRREGPP
jgi:transposase